MQYIDIVAHSTEPAERNRNSTVILDIGAKIPDLETTTLPSEMDDFGETLEPIDPDDLAGFYELEEDDTG